jgi:VanZ family protein
MGGLFHRGQRNQKNFYLLPGGIALIVAIADEIHQAYVPGRDASLTDVLLDMVGIILVLFFFFRLLKTKTSSCSL